MDGAWYNREKEMINGGGLKLKTFQKNRSVIITALIPVIVIFCVVTGVILSGGIHGSSVSFGTDLSGGWVTEDGTSTDISRLPKGIVTITHSLSGIDTYENDLCFRTNNTNVRVLFDGREGYKYKFVPRSVLFGKSYGSRINMVSVPEGVSSVTLELEPLYDKISAGISSVSVGESGAYLNEIYQKGLPVFAMCCLLFLYGILMIIVGFLTKGTSEASNVDFFSLGAFAILTGIYSSNETMILQVLTERPEAVRFCAAVALMFISYFPVSFVASVTHHRDTVFLPLLFTLDMSNFIITVILSVLGISDVALMLTFSHVCIAAAVVITFRLMFKAAKEKNNDRDLMHTIILGMSFALTGAGIDLLRYLLIKNRILGNSLFTRVGVLIFVVLMGLHLMKERTRVAVEQEKASLMEKLAYTDGLTGLKNRLAFHFKEDEIRAGNISCSIVELDINNLKKVNDVFGHAEGDRHIIGAANIISSCFSDLGTCYRTGGDEFVVIADKGELTDVVHAMNNAEKKAEEYNETEKPPVPMQIAYGYAHFTSKSDILEDVEKLADQRMYEKKKQMKAEMPAE